MKKYLLLFVKIFYLFIFVFANSQTPSLLANDLKNQNNHKQKAFIIPIKGEISTPQSYILKRALKEASSKNVDIIILDIDTPGGRVDIMLDMMQTINNYGKKTIAFINDEAISAGSFIANMCDEIYFSPNAVMGAAEAVSSSGEDISKGMKRKISSYLDAKSRAFIDNISNEENSKSPYRAKVQRAMMDPEYELVLKDEKGKDIVLKKAGELLTLTAKEAVKKYGINQENLLADAIVKDIDEILIKNANKKDIEVIHFEVAPAEKIAKYINTISPILMGIGIFLLFLEFKTPSFGLLGILGGICLGIVFLGTYIAGLAGKEIFIFLILGIVLIAIELFVLPGSVIFALAGIALIFGSLIWQFADFWPNQDFADLSFSLLYSGIMNLAFALLIFSFILALTWKILPKTSLYKSMILANNKENLSSTNEKINDYLPKIGDIGVAQTSLMPSGTILVNGENFEAFSELGFIEKGEKIEIVKISEFSLAVKKFVDKS